MLQLNPLDDPKIAEPKVTEAHHEQAATLHNVAELGLAIRAARKAMKMNQQQFAKKIGVGRRFISELEGGKPTLEFDRVLRVANFAGVALFFK